MAGLNLAGDLLLVLSGALVSNAIPHLAAGLCGKRFRTPFIRFTGQATSPAAINALWGAANLFVGLGLLLKRPFGVGFSPELLAFMAGFTVMGVVSALIFGRDA